MLYTLLYRLSHVYEKHWHHSWIQSDLYIHVSLLCIYFPPRTVQINRLALLLDQILDIHYMSSFQGHVITQYYLCKSAFQSRPMYLCILCNNFSLLISFPLLIRQQQCFPYTSPLLFCCASLLFPTVIKSRMLYVFWYTGSVLTQRTTCLAERERRVLPSLQRHCMQACREFSFVIFPLLFQR